MTETPPPRRALATFLRRPGTERSATEAPQADAAPPEAAAGAGPVPVDAVPAAPAAAASGPLPIPEALVQPAPDAAVADPSPDRSADDVLVADAPEPGAVAPGADEPPTHPPSAATGLDSRAAPSESEPLPQPAATDHGTDHPTAPLAHHRADAPAFAAATAAAPNFVRARSRVPSPRAPLWQWLTLAVLALLLTLQILLADRARLAADAGWRPLLTSLCGVFGCTLPPWHEPAAFTMLDRDVRPAADQSGALRIQASFRNDARWAQAWPWLQLSLADADGRVIGTRVFAPSEYLGHTPDGPDLLAPGQSARIDFRVREPAAGTAAFTFDFR